ncbi:proline-rich protein 36-like [Penaeus chinensis]|uniref:proline-rich protein 36-like n=1 Tax=Penaeus chinensis TaxID=139456 RepID=UPI001FB6527D|nr:proline-rich protein 36-like [Penaeus chinensis]
MKLLVIAVLVTACAGRPDDLSWDFSEWQPILSPCPSCRQGRVLQAAPVIPIKLPKSTKTGAVKASLVPLPQSSPAPTFPPARTSPAPTSKQQGGRVQLVYLPEGSIQQLNSANAARIIPTSRAPHRAESLEVVPPPLAPQAIQSIEFSDKQKRDHEGRIVQGGVNNALPMSLVTAQGKEGDALEKLRLLETALSSSSQEATVNQQDGRLPRVFIAPSHVPPPPGYVKIPLVPQSGSGAQDPRGSAPLPPTFLTPDNRNPPPGFVKFDLPPGVNQLSQDIPVVVPNSQIGPNFQPGRPALSPFPGFTRPDASINFQAQDERDAKAFGTPQSKPSIQTIPQGEAKPISPTTTPRPSPLPTTRPPVQARPTASSHSRSLLASHSLSPSSSPQILISHVLSTPYQVNHLLLDSLDSNSLKQANSSLSLVSNSFNQAGQPFPQAGQPFPQAGQPFRQPVQPFPQAGQPFPRPGQPFPQPGQPFPQSGQPFPQSGQPFPQPGQPVIQPGQPILPPRPNQNQTIFREQPIRPDFPTINGFQPNFPAIFPPNPFQPRIPQQPSPRPPTLPSPQPAQNTPRPPVHPERPSPSPFPTTTTAAPTTFHQTTPKSVLGTTPRPQLVSQTSSRPFPDPFRHYLQCLNLPQGPFDFSPRPFDSSPRPFDSSPRPFDSSPRPLDSSPRPFDSSPRPFDSSPRPFDSSPRPFDSSPRPFDSSPRPFDSSPRPFESSPRPFESSPRPFESSPRPFESSPRPFDSSPRPFDSSPRPFDSSPRPFNSFSRPPPPGPFSPFTTRPLPSPSPFLPPASFPQIPGFQEPESPQIPSFQRPLSPPTPLFSTSPNPESRFSQGTPAPEILPQNSPFQETKVPEDERFKNLQLQESHLSRVLQLQEYQYSKELLHLTSHPSRQQEHLRFHPSRLQGHPRIHLSRQQGQLSFHPSKQLMHHRLHPSKALQLLESHLSKEQQLPKSQPFQTTGAPQRTTVQERPRRPKFPSFQRPRITTASPEEDLTTIPDENDFLTPAPSTFTTPTPLTTTTIKVTTFKPRFNFNVGSRRPFIRRKPRPTPVNDGKKDNEEKKADGLKKTETTTLFPPFSVARTLNPLRKEEENAGESSSASQGITVPPSGVFGRRLRPRTRKPSTQSEGDSDSPVSTPALSNRDSPSARTRQLPAWLKSRRRLRGRFRSTTTTTEPSAQDIDYIDDTPVDILDNNGFSGAESTLVVFSRPPQNEVGEHFIAEDAVKTLAEEAEALKNEEVEEALIAAEEAVLSYAEEVDAESNREDAIHNLEENAKITETDGEEPLPEPEAEPHEPQASYEDYNAETTDVAPEPEPEPEHQTEYVTEYNEYKDDKEDNLETLHTPDQTNRNPPSLPHTQPDSHASTHSPAHAQPAGGFYQNTSVENPTINLVVEHPVEHIVDEVVEAVDDALEDNDNPIALLTDTPFDDVTEVPVQYDTEPSLEYDYESVTEQASSSHEFNETEVVDETFHVAGQEEGEKEGGEEDDELESEEEEDELESEEENELVSEEDEELESKVEEEMGANGAKAHAGDDSYQQYMTEPPEVLSLFPNDYFTALSPGESQNYDYYDEYDHYADADYTVGVDQRFSGSNAHVIFAVPVTEYIPEDTTQISLDEEATEEVIDQATEFFSITENFAEEADTEVTTEDTATTEDDSMMKETMDELVLERSESTTPLADEYTTLNPFESDSDAITTEPTTELGTIDLGTTTTARPASLRPLHTRLQEVGKKTVHPVDKKDSRSPKILSESTIREVHASDPVVCFRDNRCFRTRGLRRRRAARRSASGPALPLSP